VPRLRLLAITALVLTFTGCDGGDGKGGPDTTAVALSFVPANAPLVVVASTDFEHGQGAVARDLSGRLPGSVALLESLATRLGLDQTRDVRPLLGHDIVLSIPDRAAAAGHHLLGDTVAGDPAGVRAAVAAHVGSGSWIAQGRYRGAALYRIVVKNVPKKSATVAVRGSVILISDNAPVVRRALDLGAQGGGLQPAALRERLGDLPVDALVRVVGDARPLLSAHAARGHMAAVRALPWITALRRFAGTVRLDSQGIHARFRLDTAGRKLADADVPLATGPASPAPAGSAPLVAGLRNAAHTLAFAEQVGRALKPDAFQGLDAAKPLLRLLTGVDLDDDVIGQFTGTTTLLSDLRHFSLRADARDAGKLASALHDLESLVPRLLSAVGLPDASVDGQGKDVWVVRRAGKALARYGVVRGAFVVTTDPAANLATIAAARPAPGGSRRAQGALTARLTGPALQGALIRLLGLPPIARLALTRLGDGTASVRAERDHVEAAADLRISG
jgi:hypothetical protein